MFPAEIAATLGVSTWVVRSWARAEGILLSKSAGLVRAYEIGSRRCEDQGPRSYLLNEGFFEEPLTPSGAWVLGLLFGDGCVCQKKGVPIAVELVGDLDVCEKVTKVLGSDAQVKQLKGCYGVRFYSHRLASSLAAFGVHPAKTYSMEWPSVPEELLRHFVRGFWEADGCVTVGVSYGKPRLVLSATSCSEAFMKGLHEQVRRVSGSESKLFRVLPKGRSPRFLSSVSCFKAVRLGAWLWDDVSSEWRSDRKQGKFESMRGTHGKI
jgi:hypothetical protein